MLNMMNMMGTLKNIQSKIKESQDKLGKLRVTGESGGGMVKVIANGQRQLLQVKIDPSLMTDVEIVQDLLVAAVNQAITEADRLAKEELKKSTEGLLPNIPGLDLTNMMG